MPVIWWNLKFSNNLKNKTPTLLLLGLQNQDHKPVDLDEMTATTWILFCWEKSDLLVPSKTTTLSNDNQEQQNLFDHVVKISDQNFKTYNLGDHHKQTKIVDFQYEQSGTLE